MKHLRDTRCQLNENVRLTCSIEGIPAPTLSWEKDGKVLQPGAKYTIEVHDKQCTLVINAVQLDDSGEFYCIATNPVGRVRTSAIVSVIGKLVSFMINFTVTFLDRS